MKVILFSYNRKVNWVSSGVSWSRQSYFVFRKEDNWKTISPDRSYIICWDNVLAFICVMISLLCKVSITAFYFSLGRNMKSAEEDSILFGIQDTKNHFVKGWYPSNGEWNEPCLFKKWRCNNYPKALLRIISLQPISLQIEWHGDKVG